MAINASDLRIRLSGGFILPFTGIAGGPFTVGETITGGTSSATAVVDGQNDGDLDGSDDTLRISSIAGGPFTDTETITGGTSSATATVASAGGELLNNNPVLSLGGRLGDTTIDLVGQTAIEIGAIVGVTLVRVIGGEPADFVAGNGQINFNFAATTLAVQWPGATGFGPAIDVSSDGQYALEDGTDPDRVLIVDVVTASLPGSNTTGTFQIAPILNELFRSFTKAELIPAVTYYRCIYLVNQNSTDDFLRCSVTTDKEPIDPAAFVQILAEMGLDPVAIGDGISTGIAAIIVDEFTTPGGVTFSEPGQGDPALDQIPLLSGDALAVWIELTHPAGAVQAMPQILGRIGARVFF